MKRNLEHVPYGYVPPVKQTKGTLIYYDDFESATDIELDAALEAAQGMKFARLVLYPLHEETVRRMSKKPVSAFYKREDLLHDWKRDRNLPIIAVEGWEGKRKKYTPLEAALRHLAEHYPSPYFLYVTPETANLFASYSTFEEWITKIRLLLTRQPEHPHPRLTKFGHRWSVAGEGGE